MTEDLPTLERPAKVTWGLPSRMNVEGFTAERTNSTLLKLMAMTYLLIGRIGHDGRHMLHRVLPALRH